MKDLVTVDLNFSGVVNGEPLSCSGNSYGAFGDGDIDCALVARHAMPRNMCIGLLSYVGLTGQPSMSDVIEGAHNPFLGTEGVYKATRSLDMGDFGRLMTTYTVASETRGKLVANFDVRGNVHIPRLVAIRPCIETWTPKGPGHISGQFTMVWEGENGEVIQGITNSDYILPTNDTIETQQFREIRINIDTSNPSKLRQTEHIALFAPNLLLSVLDSEPQPTDSIDAARVA